MGTWDRRDVSNSRGKKIRLVVGLLSTADQLASALAELGKRNLMPEQIRLIGQPSVLDSFLGRSPTGNHSAAPAQSWTVFRPEPHGTFGPSPEGANPDGQVLEHIRAIVGARYWALRRQAQQLDRHLGTGGVLIVVKADTDDQEWEACTALLRHASGIQTHEVADSQR
jgi:hypothetical protein